MSDAPLPARPAPDPTASNAATRRWNTLAIVGFVLSFSLGLAGIVLGIIAVVRIRATGERGRGLAVAAIAVGAVVMLGSALFEVGDVWDLVLFSLAGVIPL